MNKKQALKIIEEEHLQHYNIGQNRPVRENELVIICENELWKVYATDERASVVTGSEIVFKNENDAWDNLIKRLRADKILNEYAE